MNKIKMRKAPLALAIAAVALGATSPALGFNFETEGGLKGSFDSTISFGMQRRMKSQDLSLVGNDSGGNAPISSPLGVAVNGPGFGATASPDFNYAQVDDGNLNYKKGDIVSSVLKGTHELGLRQEGNWAALARVTWSTDFSAAKTQRTPLDDEARKAVEANASILDLWVSKDFRLGENSAKVKFGNQVLSWGEDIFIIGGINTINAVDLRKAHIPGTQVKEILLPAPIVSFSTALGSGFSTEAYYQLKWNKLILDPAGTFWSTADFLGKGGRRGAFIPTSVMDPNYAGGTPLGTFGDFDPTRGRPLDYLANSVAPGLGNIVPIETTSPKNSGQFGVNMRFKPQSGDTEYAAYYIRYHDKIPFVGFRYDPATANVINISAVEQYAEDKSVLGVSLNTKLGDWAIGAELSYRPRDSVAIDPTVPLAGPYSYFNANFGGPQAYTVDGYKNEKKWQAHVTGFKLLPPDISRALGAAEGYFLGELAITHYPTLDLSGAVPYLLNDYTLPTKTSWGYVAEIGMTYANIFGSGWTFSPILDFFHDVKGTSPNTLPFVEGRKALALALNFDYHNQTKISVGYTSFSGGGTLNLMRDRDIFSAMVLYTF